LPSIVFDLKNGLEGITAYEHKLQKAKDTFRQAWDKLTPAEVENWLIRPLSRNPNLHHSYGRFQEKVRTHLQTLQDTRPDYVKNGEFFLLALELARQDYKLLEEQVKHWQYGLSNKPHTSEWLAGQRSSQGSRSNQNNRSKRDAKRSGDGKRQNKPTRAASGTRAISHSTPGTTTTSQICDGCGRTNHFRNECKLNTHPDVNATGDWDGSTTQTALAARGKSQLEWMTRANGNKIPKTPQSGGSERTRSNKRFKKG
jgi:hypothetical protein